MVWSVTGWSGGSRQPLTYRLRAGESRGMGTVRGYGNNIFINKNYLGFSGYDYGCTCNYADSTPKWMNWMMGLGMGTSFFGNIMSMFGFGGGGAVEGQGGSKTNTDAQAQADKNCTNIKTLFGDDVASVVFINSQYNARLKDGTILTASDPTSLINSIKDKLSTKSDNENKPDKKTNESKPEQSTSVSKPMLFKSDKMATLTDTDAVLTQFKTATGATATSIDSLGNGGITISAVIDKGNNTQVTANIKLEPSDLTALKNSQTVIKSNMNGKDVSFENLDGYIRMKVGAQTYIVGSLTQDNNIKYNAYQYEAGNVIGWKEPNWTNKNK